MYYFLNQKYFLGASVAGWFWHYAPWGAVITVLMVGAWLQIIFPPRAGDGDEYVRGTDVTPSQRLRRDLGGDGVELGGILIPRKLESQHFLLVGAPGSGKSTAIRRMLRQIEARGECAVVLDPECEYLPERVLVVSPANEERRQLNSAIRELLKQRSHVAAEGKEQVIFVNRDLTAAQRQSSQSYEVGDVVRYLRYERGRSGSAASPLGHTAQVAARAPLRAAVKVALAPRAPAPPALPCRTLRSARLQRSTARISESSAALQTRL